MERLRAATAIPPLSSPPRGLRARRDRMGSGKRRGLQQTTTPTSRDLIGLEGSSTPTGFGPSLDYLWDVYTWWLDERTGGHIGPLNGRP